MVNHRSDKLAEIYVERRAIVERLLSERPLCQRCVMRAPVDVHEVKSRARSGGARANGGAAILDESNLAVLCRPCHEWVTTHPEDAHAEGWLAHEWETDYRFPEPVVVDVFDPRGPDVQMVEPFRWLIRGSRGDWHQLDITGYEPTHNYGRILSECSCEQWWCRRDWCPHTRRLLEVLPVRWPRLDAIIDRSILFVG